MGSPYRCRPRGDSGCGGTKDYIPDNGICERFHRTLLDEFYRVAFRKKIYRTVDELQTDLDDWLIDYNEQRPHQ
ncbi:MAG: transposase, partial [Bryobacterales bacterium]|nr:transposase [Bryobacterales bacterium]